MSMKIKNIDGFEGYKVSYDGNVYGKRSGSPMVGGLNGHGYRCVTLRKNNKNHTKKVHRLVADAFIQKKHKETEVNHIDGNKLNNHAGNLEWCTRAENLKHARETGLSSPNGLIKSKRKLEPLEVSEIRGRFKRRCKKNGTKALAHEFNVSQSLVSFIVNNKRRTGYEHLLFKGEQ